MLKSIFIVFYVKGFSKWCILFTRSDILQGQALFIRVKQKNLFCFRTTDRKTDIQKRQKGRNDRKTRKINRQKDTRNIDRKYKGQKRQTER